MLRFSQWLMMPASNAAAQATPPSWKAKCRSGKRIGTPPKTSDRQSAFVGGGEVADLVVGVVDGRLPGAPALAAGVEGGCHAEFLAAPPDRVVVVERVVTEGVEPAPGAAAAVVRAGDDTHEHDGLESEFDDGMVEFGDGFLGRVDRDGGDRLETIAVAGVHLGVIAVQRTRQRHAQLVVRHAGHEAIGGVDHREVDADLVESPVHQVGQHDRGPVEGVLRRQPPDPGGEHAELAPLRRRRYGRSRGRRVRHAVEHPGDVLAGVFHDEVPHQRQVLDLVTVAVDDRVVDPVADGRRPRRTG